MDKNNLCSVCGGVGAVIFTTTYARVAQCRKCSHLYAVDAVPGAGTQPMHAKSDVDKYRDRNRRLFAFWRRIGFMRPGMKVLDFGAGIGHIPIQLKDDMPSLDIECVEVELHSRQWLATRGLSVLETPEGPYDAAYMIEVLEHLDEPVATLRTIRAALPRGTLFLTTPCGQTRLGSFRTNAYDTPEHIHFFTEKSLKLALALAGFPNVRLLVVNALYLDRNPAKAFLRHVRARLMGHSHLVALAS